MEDNEQLNWASNTIYLADYLLSKNKFRDVKCCLEDAEEILRDQKEVLKTKEPSDGLLDSLFCECYHQRTADVAAIWVKYGLGLFEISKMNSLKQNKSHQMIDNLRIVPLQKNSEKYSLSSKVDVVTGGEPNFEFEKITSTDLKKLKQNKKRKSLESIPEEKQGFCLFNHKVVLEDLNNDDEKVSNHFFNLPWKHDYQNYEEVAVNLLVKDTEQARALFNSTHDWLKRVKFFYNLRSNPMEHINACMDLNELYKYLAFYEENIESQSAVHKLRLAALETLSTDLHEVRPDWYRAVSAELLQELAKVQLELLELNLHRIYAVQTSELNQSLLSVDKIKALSDLHVKLKEW